jgi:hypothetical protein
MNADRKYMRFCICSANLAKGAKALANSARRVENEAEEQKTENRDREQSAWILHRQKHYREKMS